MKLLLKSMEWSLVRSLRSAVVKALYMNLVTLLMAILAAEAEAQR